MTARSYLLTVQPELGNVKRTCRLSELGRPSPSPAPPAPAPLDLARMGLNLIPLRPREKVPPDGFTWKDFQNTGTTPEQVEEWGRRFPDSNWGLLLGRPSGLLALDVDDPSVMRWVDGQGGTGPGVWYETGRGWQWLFRLPPDLADARTITPHPGVEVRANGSYSVVPPSVHPSGTPYRWRTPPTSLEAIPYPPAWIVRLLKGRAPATASETGCRGTFRQTFRGEVPPTAHPAVELRPNPRLLSLPGARWIEANTFPRGHRNAAFLALCIIFQGAGLTRRDAEERLSRWRLAHTSPTYGTFPDKAREPGDVFAVAWRTPYGLSADRLTALRTVNGEAMPEDAARELVRAYPIRRGRPALIHRPLLEAVAQCLVALYEAKAWKDTPLSHAELAARAGLTEKRVEHVAAFLTKIGVRRVTRHGSSTVSVYSLKHLHTAPPRLIEELGRWRGYKVPWRLLAWRLWRTSGRFIRAALSVLDAVWNRILETWGGELGGEVVPAAAPIITASSRAPPSSGEARTAPEGVREEEKIAVHRGALPHSRVPKITDPEELNRKRDALKAANLAAMSKRGADSLPSVECVGVF